MTIEIIATYAAGLALLIGSAFVLIGALGLMKFNDPMTRLHAPTKVGTLGIGMLLLASILAGFATEAKTFHELLIMAFLFVTAPVSANFIAKVSLHRRDCMSPPAPEHDNVWATFDAPESEIVNAAKASKS